MPWVNGNDAVSDEMHAAVARTGQLVEKGAVSFAAKVEGASKTVGTVAGTLHRSFTETKGTGVAEIELSRSN
jgi:hypothetical protein